MKLTGWILVIYEDTGKAPTISEINPRNWRLGDLCHGGKVAAVFEAPDENCARTVSDALCWQYWGRGISMRKWEESPWRWQDEGTGP